MPDTPLADKLVRTWSALPSSPPYVLDVDRQAAPQLFASKHVIEETRETWPLSRHFLQLAPEVSSALHVNLFPEPYAGDIRTAPVVVLMKNPGFNQRLYEEHGVSAYREAMRRNLEQRHAPGERRLFWFRPEFIMHGGFQYFGARFAPLLQRWDSPQQALEILDRTVCVVQMTGYTSQNSPSGLARLPSTQAVFDWLRQEVLPDVQGGRRALIIARAKKEWITALSGPDQRWVDFGAGSCENLAVEERPTRIPSFDATRDLGKLLSTWMAKVADGQS